jgi:replicative DNA helicase
MSAKRKVLSDPLAPEETGPIANVELERALLGCILLSPESIERVQPHVLEEDFSERVHSRIYEVCLTLAEQQRPISPITLRPYLKDLDLGEITVSQYLARLAAGATPVINAVEFAKEVKRFSQRRKLVDLADHIRLLAPDMQPDQDVNSVVEAVSAMLEDIRSGAGEGEVLITMGQALKQSLDAVASAYERDAPMAGLPTGLADLDSAVGGLSPSDLVILAARPGMGKTAMACGWMRAVARHDPTKYAVMFSQEMAAMQIGLRELSEATKIASVRLKNGKIGQEDFEQLRDAVRDMEGLPILIDPSPSVKLSYIGRQLRKIARKHPISMIVIDYLQLLEGPGNVKGRNGNRNEELTVITAGLKSLAKRYNVPVVALSQLNRKVEDRDDKRPQMADLKDAGSIEQDADVVLGIYREEYYLGRLRPAERYGEKWDRWRAEMDRWRGLAEVLVMKHRHAPTDTVLVGWDGETTSFRTLEEDEKQITPGENIPTKVRINKAHVPIYRAIKDLIDKHGEILANESDVPPDLAVATLKDCFEAYMATRIVMDGDDVEKARKDAWKQFRASLIWLQEEGVVRTVTKKRETGQTGWVWLTGRKVRI